MLRRTIALAVLVLVGAVPAAAQAPAPTLEFRVFASTGLALGHVVWSGRELLYVPQWTGAIKVADANGRIVRDFATFEPNGEEMRCAPSPSKLWPEGVYCHTPDRRIMRIALDGSVRELARLPGPLISDGSIAFDTVGRFGYALLAATGGSSTNGGEVFAIRKDGRVQPIGAYPGPGGADNIAIAPARFGRASGRLLLSIDHDSVSGRVLAIDRDGTVRAVATGLGNGLNPIMVIAPPSAKRAPGAPPAGVYLGDVASKDVLFAPAASLKAYVGSVLVGTELTGELWLIRPNPFGGFVALPITTNLAKRPYNLEGGTFVP